MEYQLEKHIWTEEDFAIMGWHDCRIHGIDPSLGLVLDIDYILEWIMPDLEGLPFTFRVAPATLVFKDVSKLDIDLELLHGDTAEIEDMDRVVTDAGIEWTIMTHEGNIRFSSTGYKQYIRQEPFFSIGQYIPLEERGGISFESTISQENPVRYRADMVARRERDNADYQVLKQWHLKQRELEKLLASERRTPAELKAFLLAKRELNEAIAHYNFLLEGTLFEDW